MMPREIMEARGGACEPGTHEGLYCEREKQLSSCYTRKIADSLDPDHFQSVQERSTVATANCIQVLLYKEDTTSPNPYCYTKRALLLMTMSLYNVIIIVAHESLNFIFALYDIFHEYSFCRHAHLL